MGDILGVGLTHYPSIIAPDEDWMFPLTRMLRSNDRVPPEWKHPSRWPEPMRLEYGDDEGLTAAKRHRERLVTGFRHLPGEVVGSPPPPSWTIACLPLWTCP